MIGCPAQWREGGRRSRAPGSIRRRSAARWLRPRRTPAGRHRAGGWASRSCSRSVSMRPRASAASTPPQPRRQTGSRLRCGSDPTAGAHRSASPSSDSASARRVQQACSSVRKLPSRTRGRLASAWRRSPRRRRRRRGRRSLALDPVTVAALRRHRSRQHEHRLLIGARYQIRGWCSPGRTDHRFTRCASRGGSSSTPDRPVCRGFAYIDLRHSHASAALAAGVPAKVISERLGHATIAVTMDIYSHVLPGLERKECQVDEGTRPRRAPGRDRLGLSPGASAFALILCTCCCADQSGCDRGRRRPKTK
jgi:hypothetical protein